MPPFRSPRRAHTHTPVRAAVGWRPSRAENGFVDANLPGIFPDDHSGRHRNRWHIFGVRPAVQRYLQQRPGGVGSGGCHHHSRGRGVCSYLHCYLQCFGRSGDTGCIPSCLRCRSFELFEPDSPVWLGKPWLVGPKAWATADAFLVAGDVFLLQYHVPLSSRYHLLYLHTDALVLGAPLHLRPG